MSCPWILAITSRCPCRCRGSLQRSQSLSVARVDLSRRYDVGQLSSELSRQRSGAALPVDICQALIAGSDGACIVARTDQIAG